MKPRLLDLFCGAGMAADGYAAAGFEVVGVDNEPQPHYPFPFLVEDALVVLRALAQRQAGLVPDDHIPGLGDFDAIHASPPCQLFTRAKHLRDAQGGKSKAVDLLTPTLDLLRGIGLPWIVENVENAKSLMQPQPGEHLVRVCGSFWGLEVQRHRLFLSNVPIKGKACQHGRFPLDPVSGKPRPWGVYHVPSDSIPQGGRTARDANHARELFGMTRSLPWDSLKEGFPPIYTEWIGYQIRQALEERAAALQLWKELTA